MATDNLDDVFGTDALVEAAPIEETPPEVVEQEAETPTEPEPEPATVQEEPEARHVPLAAHLDERDRRKAAERERDELRQKYEASQQRPAQNIPDAYDDPQGFAAYVESQVDQRATALRFEMSDRFARQAHGEDAVQSATDWAMQRAQSNPAFAQEYMAQQDPIGWIVQQHKRDAMLSDIGDNPDDWFEREAAKRGWQKQTAPASAAVVDAAPKQAPTPARVPRSLANQGGAQSDIRHVATGPLAGVDSLFT